jgi:arylsulfatase A-like enzyme
MADGVVLLTVDCLRPDFLGMYGSKKGLSPRMDDIASHSLLFKNAFSNSSTTFYSFKSILTSTYPNLYRDENALSQKRMSVAEVFRQNGWTTAGFHQNPFLSRYFGYDRGFQEFWDSIGERRNGGRRVLPRMPPRLKMAFNQIKAIGSARASTLNENALEWIKKQKGKFFLWIHYMDTHVPFFPPIKYAPFRFLKTLKTNFKLTKPFMDEKDVHDLKELYTSEIRFVDKQIGYLFDEIDSSKKDIVFAVSADHGEEFLEHKGIGHPSRLSKEAIFGRMFQGESPLLKFGFPPKLYDELIHVPLIIHVPWFNKKSVDEMVDMIDLSPTLIELAGLKKPDKFQGESLLPVVTNEREGKKEVFSEYGWSKISCRSRHWKLIQHNGAKEKKYELYNLKEDPGEQKNLAEEELDVLSDLKGEIKEHKTRLEKRRVKGKIKNIKPDRTRVNIIS